ncbi:hypothetical protein [Frankia sp. R82]|uniref:hypothetical protein n=1 Tax=Frankia sp. R82 TaxID=2950553 RepID=UPI0020436FFF|nr:hypothetical protein [Frankia sp. R82]MCM3884124.1 hypothetical protein [Frankia sp. R82]
MHAPGERTYTKAELDSLISVEDLTHLLGRLRGDRVSRSYANRIANQKGFPDPLIDRPQLRLWLRADVEAWLDRNRRGWREARPRPTG